MSDAMTDCYSDRDEDESCVNIYVKRYINDNDDETHEVKIMGNFDKAIDIIMSQPPEPRYPAYYAGLLKEANIPD